LSLFGKIIKMIQGWWDKIWRLLESQKEATVKGGGRQAWRTAATYSSQMGAAKNATLNKDQHIYI
jgi:hypothetical protein